MSDEGLDLMSDWGQDPIIPPDVCVQSMTRVKEDLKLRHRSKGLCPNIASNKPVEWKYLAFKTFPTSDCGC